MALVKIFNAIVVDTDDAENACYVIDTSLHHMMNKNDFPAGEVVAVNVDHFKNVTDTEAYEKGWTE